MLRKPHRVPIAARIIVDLSYYIKTVVEKERTVFLAVETRMKERLTLIAPDRLTERWSRGKHEYGAGRCVRFEYREHPPLVSMTEMKEAVPRDNAVKLPR